MTDGARLAVIDHGAGNLVSISQALARCGARPQVVTDPSLIGSFDGVVLPGVGAMATVMDGIERGGFSAFLRSPTTPLLGICVGMQVLFEGSDEDDSTGLGLLKGRVRRLPDAPSLPHIGWNDLDTRPHAPLFEGLDNPLVYFVHSFAAVPEDDTVVTAVATHGRPFVAAAAVGSVFGVQFHPERSGATGLRILNRFVAACQDFSRAA